jgi:hypothetical protein
MVTIIFLIKLRNDLMKDSIHQTIEKIFNSSSEMFSILFLFNTVDKTIKQDQKRESNDNSKIGMNLKQYEVETK